MLVRPARPRTGRARRGTLRLGRAPVSADATGYVVRTDVRSENYGNEASKPQQLVNPPEGIMLHHTGGSKNGDLATLTRWGTWVSSNDYITKEPQIFELVPHPRRSWHGGTADAGTGYRLDGNTYYWGIEIENLGNGRDPYPKAQIDAIVWRCRGLRRRWPNLKNPSQLFRHRDYAPSRKGDPSDNFPYAEVKRRVFAATDPTDAPGTKPAPTAGLTRLKVPAQQLEAFYEEFHATLLVTNLVKAGVPKAKIVEVREGGYHKVRLLAYQHGAYATSAELTKARNGLTALGVETTTEKAGATPAQRRPSPWLRSDSSP